VYLPYYVLNCSIFSSLALFHFVYSSTQTNDREETPRPRKQGSTTTSLATMGHEDFTYSFFSFFLKGREGAVFALPSRGRVLLHVCFSPSVPTF
jgi:hypothetical protein